MGAGAGAGGERPGQKWRALGKNGLQAIDKGFPRGCSQGGLPHFLALSWNSGRCKLQRAQGFCSPSVPGPYPPNLPVSPLSPTPSREMARPVSALGSGHWILSLSLFLALPISQQLSKLYSDEHCPGRIFPAVRSQQGQASGGTTVPEPMLAEVCSVLPASRKPMPRYALAAHATSVSSPSLGCEGPPARTSLGCGRVGKVRVEDKAHVGTLPPQGLPLRTSQELRTAAPTLSQ